MADLLIRDVPDDVVAAVDAHAGRLGLSRSEYLRRTLAREQRVAEPVSLDDLSRLADQLADLDDPAVMAQAWS